MKKTKHTDEMEEYLYPKECSEALRKWDIGQPLFTVEMGGLGPGYEQCIHVMCFEIIRDWLGTPLPDFSEKTEVIRKAWSDWGDASITRVDAKLGGVSGAQAGAAKSLAYRALRDGWRKCILSAPKDRLIQVSKNFPSGGAL